MATIGAFIKEKKLSDASETEIIQSFLTHHATSRGSSISVAPASGAFSRNMETLDLEGREFSVDAPIRIRKLHGAVVSNGAIKASKSFPKDAFLLDIQEVNTLKLENLLLECGKRSSGIFANKFLRLRIEDCSIIHQTEYGIFANDQGYNHELEVVKCNIVEFLWGDGVTPATKGKLPNFKESRARTSTGVFLGQADNVVADCNINLCRIGIRVGMRANRIQGNHITAGGTIDNEIFDGIVLNKHIKSSCLIVNNYVDNCRIVLNINDRPVNARNYVTITDNLFYKGYNHPSGGREFSHIVIRALRPKAVLQNVIIANNQFYNQDEHLEGLVERRIHPIAVESAWKTGEHPRASAELNSARIAGAIVRDNAFTNVNGYYETPIGTRVTIVTEKPERPCTLFEADFSRHLVWGEIYSCNATMLCEDLSAEPVPFFVSLTGRKAVIKTQSAVKAQFSITVDVARPYTGYGAVVS